MTSNELFEVRRRRHVGEINIVPILDMLTTIIFFLLISASFLQFNKISIPASKTSLLETSEVPPRQPRLMLAKTSEGQKLVFCWGGQKPGTYSQVFSATADIKMISVKATEFATNFKKQFGDETTVQVGLGKTLPYSNLVALMDAVRNQMPNVVLVSYEDAQIASERVAGSSQ